jgi:hypothetical protein
LNNKLKLGVGIFLGTLAIGPALQAFGMILCGLLLIGFALIVIGLFPDVPEEQTNYPAGSHLPGGEELYNEIAEQGAFDSAPAYGRWGDAKVGYSWTGHDKDGSYAEYITWFENGKSWRQRVK